MVIVCLMRNLKIALCQIKVLKDKKKNLHRTEKMITDAASRDSDIIILPEMFNCPYDKKYFPFFAENYPGETTGLLSALAKKYSVYIIGGSIPEKEDDNIYNTSYIFDRKGKLIARYRKIHLFDVSIKGGIQFRESDTLQAGQDLAVFETEFCKIGVAICYDMRFPELIRKMVLKDALVIVVPAAFNMTTGPAHWHILSRTRALDNQIYLIVVSPARNRKAEYIAYGHSLVVDPWGKIIAEAGIYEEVLTAKIDLDYILKIREALPLLKHRKEEVYK